MVESNTPGPRILVWGSSCAGKSTLAAHFANELNLKLIDLDALNWLPGWVGLNTQDPDRFVERMKVATAGNNWVVSGSYSDLAKPVFWSRITDVVWLDLPYHTLIYRCLTRSWERSRSKKLLWGTCRESFLTHLAVWREESLLYWITRNFWRRRRHSFTYISDGTWQNARVVRITSARELGTYLTSIGMPFKTAIEDLETAPVAEEFLPEEAG